MTTTTTATTTTTTTDAPGRGAASPGPIATRPSALTARQGEIARLIARGLSNRRIAAALAVSARTAEWHVANLLGKLGLQSRTALAVWAAEHELASTEAP